MEFTIHISCNDVATSGSTLGVLLLYQHHQKPEDEIESIMIDASRADKEIIVEIIGGHTEITDGVNRIIISTTVIGKQKKSKIPSVEDIKVGDKVLVTKYVGIEGTSIIAKELEDKLRDKIGEEGLKRRKPRPYD